MTEERRSGEFPSEFELLEEYRPPGDDDEKVNIPSDISKGEKLVLQALAEQRREARRYNHKLDFSLRAQRRLATAVLWLKREMQEQKDRLSKHEGDDATMYGQIARELGTVSKAVVDDRGQSLVRRTYNETLAQTPLIENKAKVTVASAFGAGFVMAVYWILQHLHLVP